MQTLYKLPLIISQPSETPRKGELKGKNKRIWRRKKKKSATYGKGVKRNYYGKTAK